MVAQLASLPEAISIALKEWAVAVRALREGRQVFLLRKGGIREEGGEFEVAARDVLLFPTYLHEEEQRNSLQSCYTAWLNEETRRRPVGDVERIEVAARVTHIDVVTDPDALYRLSSQHIYSDAFLTHRIENEPNKPLYVLFLRAYELPEPISIPMELDYYGCKSWITLTQPVRTSEARPVMSDRTYAERVRVIQRHLTGGGRSTDRKR
jgi:hypothetical protein